ncbi:MAG: hypothetical protein IPM98_04330 [Lewinellaceae bacterium]|nr:hypothetical protein [Lewinellaceae bacterium]
MENYRPSPGRRWMACLLFFGAVTFLHLPVCAQIAINTDSSAADPSAMLDVKSSIRGVLVPRMSTAQRTAIAAPATGLLVFDATTTTFWFFNGAIWVELGAGPGRPDRR